MHEALARVRGGSAIGEGFGAGRARETENKKPAQGGFIGWREAMLLKTFGCGGRI